MIYQLKQGNNLGVVAVTIALVLLLVIAACAPTPVAVKEKKEISVGASFLFTGLAASTGVPIAKGAIDYISHTNDTGGIEGIPVKLVWGDNASVPARGVPILKRHLYGGAVLLLEHFSTSTELIASALEKEKVPLVFEAWFTPGMATKDVRWIFTAFPPTSSEWVMCLEWLKDNWTEPRKPRVGFISLETAAGHDYMEGGKYAEEQGWIEAVGYQLLPIAGVIDTSTEWLRLAGEETDWIFVRYCSIIGKN